MPLRPRLPIAYGRHHPLQTIPLYGDGLNVRDWVHVVDNCEGILAALECGKAGEAYNIGGSNECSNRGA